MQNSSHQLTERERGRGCFAPLQFHLTTLHLRKLMHQSDLGFYGFIKEFCVGTYHLPDSAFFTKIK